MKRLFILIVTAISLIRCSNNQSQANNQSNSDSTVKDTSINPIDFEAQIKDSFKIPLIDASVLEKVKKKQNQTKGILPTECDLPKTLRELNSGLKIQFYRADKNNQGSLSAMGIGINLGKKELILLKDYQVYKNVRCELNDSLRYGISVRLLVHVVNAKGGADLSGFSKIAASVELGKATASYSLFANGFGISGDLAKKVLLSGQQDKDFTVDNYSDVINSFNTLVSAINDGSKDVSISPVQLPYSKE